MASIKELITASGMTQKAFSDYFGIPKRSVENWYSSKRECPKYLTALIYYKLTKEGILPPEE